MNSVTGMRTLNDYGVIGNLHTAAVVSRFGGIDWACLPRFAAPSVFGRLVGGPAAGFHLLAPTEPFRSRQEYRPSTCVLDTRFELSHGRRLRVTDLMPVVPRLRPEGAPMILRSARAEGGTVPVEVRFDPRFDYARRPTSFRPVPGGVEAHAGADRMRSTLSWPQRIEDGQAVARGELRDGDRLDVELYWGGSRPVPDPFPELVAMTYRFWLNWAHEPGSPLHRLVHPWHRWVERSELTLKLLAHADTGAFVAAPTTSLPEWPGGARNWDYRYVWIRDAAFTAHTMIELGHYVEARAFLRWALLRVRESPTHHLRVVYGAHGESDLTESTLPQFEGFWNSRPVRIGNAAAEQFQLDIYGEFLNVALLLERVDPEFVSEHWAEVSALADQVVRLWRSPDRGIWEVRGPPRHYVHSKLMAWVALDRAVRIAHRLDGDRRVGAWTREAEEVRRWLETDGYDPESGSFKQASDANHADAANLRIPLVGFLPYDDPRVRATIDRVRKELSSGPFVYRYRAPDGLEGKEGAFLPTSFWMVECLARSGRAAEARAAWKALLRAGTPLDLFSEEYDPARHLALGNFPQALTHLALLRAATALGEQIVRESVEEPPRPPARSIGRAKRPPARARDRP